MCKEIKRNLSQQSLHLKRWRLPNGAEITFHPKLVNQKHPFPSCCSETGWGNERLMFQFLTSSLDLQCLRSCRLCLPISQTFTIPYALNNNNDLTLKRKAKNCASIHTREILPNIILSLLISRHLRTSCIKISPSLVEIWKIYVRLHTRWYERLPKDFLSPKMRFACWKISPWLKIECEENQTELFEQIVLKQFNDAGKIRVPLFKCFLIWW